MELVTDLEKHDRMLARVVDEELLEVVAGRGEDDLVTLEASPVTGEGHVSEGLGVEQPLKHGEHVGLVLGPPQAEHLGQRVQPGDGQLRQQAAKRKWLEKVIRESIFCMRVCCL